jgi:hypothetical protein
MREPTIKPKAHEGYPSLSLIANHFRNLSELGDATVDITLSSINTLA